MNLFNKLSRPKALVQGAGDHQICSNFFHCYKCLSILLGDDLMKNVYMFATYKWSSCLVLGALNYFLTILKDKRTFLLSFDLKKDLDNSEDQSACS